jgi:hypothetical protein
MKLSWIFWALVEELELVLELLELELVPETVVIAVFPGRCCFQRAACMPPLRLFVAFHRRDVWLGQRFFAS